MKRDELAAMTDDGVLEGVAALARRSNEITAELLAFLGEVEERRLYLREATSSMFVFCTERLHMAEGAAYKRIHAARAARRFPVILELLGRGEIHLAAITLLAPHLTQDNHAELMARARHLSKRAIEKLVAEIAPRPDVPPRVRAVPLAEAGPSAQADLLADPAEPRSDLPRGKSLTPGTPSPRPAVVAPLSPRRYEIRITVDQETHDRLRQLQDLFSHQAAGRDLAATISRALEVALAWAMTRRAAVTEKPRPGRPQSKRSRSIPAAVRRQVWRRDSGRCAFLDGQGRRCSSTAFIQFHHLDNWAQGGEHSVERVELRCQAHNQYHAVLDYGAELMAARRRGPSPAREPRATYGAGAGGLARQAPAGRGRRAASGAGAQGRCRRNQTVSGKSGSEGEGRGPGTAGRAVSEAGRRRGGGVEQDAARAGDGAGGLVAGAGADVGGCRRRRGRRSAAGGGRRSAARRRRTRRGRRRRRPGDRGGRRTRPAAAGRPGRERPARRRGGRRPGGPGRRRRAPSPGRRPRRRAGSRPRSPPSC